MLAASLLLSTVHIASAAAAGRAEAALADGWQFRHVARGDWYAARVPGSVHLDLLASRLIEDPFDGENERHQQWIGKADWEYRLEFPLPAPVVGRRNVDLVFEGLDTYAMVDLNGARILDADNMYRRWRVPAASRLRAGGNTLRVVFRSPIAEKLAAVTADGYELPAVNDQGEKTSPYTRKAPYQFGWDWGPRLVTCGIWKPVRLEAWDDLRIEDLVVRQRSLDDRSAQMTAAVEIVWDERRPRSTPPRRLVVEVTPPDQPPFVVEAPLADGQKVLSIDFAIPNPQRWWPNGLGAQPLYAATARVLAGALVLDEKKTRIGLRTLELRRAADQWGKSFEFVVNGVAVFAKGADWVPADSFPTRVTRERYASLLGSARAAHMNMLRVWAGGIYESDDFYDLADEMGLLLWQDFEFSCSLYPADRRFLDSVRHEAEDAVRRLRNHPSLALWCGNNEIEAGWSQWGWKERLPGWLWDDYERLFHGVLPAVVASQDGTRSYWPSSPSANREAEPGSPESGDVHSWGVWHGGEPFRAYERQVVRFMSEYGFQSFPELRTLRSFAREKDLALESPVMLAHQRNARGNQIIRDYLLREYPPPRDFPAFVYLSQVQQAEGVKIGAEHLRRMRPRTMGSLYWQLDDCWPVASWSSLDYFGRWKALHYYARRFYGELLVSTAEDEGGLAVWATSDRTSATEATLVVRLMDLAGTVVREQRTTVSVPPSSSQAILRLTPAELLGGADPRRSFLHVALLVDGGVASENSRFFVPARDLALTTPKIAVDVTAGDGDLRVSLAADTLARHVRLAYDRDDGSWSDNYFDLLPGRPMTVRFTPKGSVTAAELRSGLEVTSLVDAFGPR